MIKAYYWTSYVLVILKLNYWKSSSELLIIKPHPLSKFIDLFILYVLSVILPKTKFLSPNSILEYINRNQVNVKLMSSCNSTARTISSLTGVKHYNYNFSSKTFTSFYSAVAALCKLVAVKL